MIALYRPKCSQNSWCRNPMTQHKPVSMGTLTLSTIQKMTLISHWEHQMFPGNERVAVMSEVLVYCGTIVKV